MHCISLCMSGVGSTVVDSRACVFCQDDQLAIDWIHSGSFKDLPKVIGIPSLLSMLPTLFRAQAILTDLRTWRFSWGDDERMLGVG